VRLRDFKSKRNAVELVQLPYATVAVSVKAVDLYSNAKGETSCDRLVVKMPKRQAVHRNLSSLSATSFGVQGSGQSEV